MLFGILSWLLCWSISTIDCVSFYTTQSVDVGENKYSILHSNLTKSALLVYMCMCPDTVLAPRYNHSVNIAINTMLG